MPPEIGKALPGIAGSVTAMLFIREGGRLRAIFTCMSGMILAQFIGPSAAEFMHSTVAVAGYVTGLFGMAIVSKMFETLNGINTAHARRDLWDAIVRRVRG